ncbi:MAG TPA: two-component regulator propeller domain-containing protein, partial [Chitinophagaceae bacterium]|nr:two-component regulator propeller domain-containing protein [Chitinophagaceae bacterium]
MAPPEGKVFTHITGMVQDKQGYMWFASKSGLFRYDGYQMVYFRNNPFDPNSLSVDQLESICIDSSGNLWIGTYGAGLDRYDPVTGTFTHFRHNPNDPSSLADDTVSVLLTDKNGTLWVGSQGLSRFDPKTGRFIHYQHNPNDPGSISSNEVMAIYEDRLGELWIGTGSVYGPFKNVPSAGGLNRLDRRTGTFTRFVHDPNNPQSL